MSWDQTTNCQGEQRFPFESMLVEERYGDDGWIAYLRHWDLERLN